MLCSECKKNMAVIYINKLDKDGKPLDDTVGYCLECAKKKNINPINGVMSQFNNLSEEDMNNINKQVSNILGNMSPELIEKMEQTFGGFPDDFTDEVSFSNETDFDNKDLLKSNLKEGKNTKKQSNEDYKKNTKTKYLDVYGMNLTKKARDNKLDRVIGREVELQRMIQILNRRSKNNPALIGEPGVGKTAIVNALAIAIAEKKVPSKLLKKEVYLIDLTSLVAGTQFRGQFEARVKGLIDECVSFGNIILAIDELHNIVGGIEHDNSMNVANMLKPALANGSIQLIGATTLKEYRQNIEKDTALERRFQPIIVEEPNFNDTFEIIKGIKDYYENYHKVKINDTVIKDCIRLSSKYIHDRFLPDKAIDLLDEACSMVNLDDITLANIDKITDEIDKIKDENKEIEELKEDEKTIEIYEKAAKLKEEECKLQTELLNLKKKIKPRGVTFDDVARVVELWTKIPVTRIKTTDSEKLLNLENNLKKRLIGQDHAVHAISNAILRKRAGIKSIERPPSFIFVGPTGVGKTELVKCLAYELFDNKDAVIKLDMSEYMESHSVSKLIGSPPGYVGYDEAGNLTEKVRRNPYSIILFDEIEKAHNSIYNLLLQILDEGKLTDSQGKTVSFKHTIIVLTSNLGTNFKNDSFGFGTKSSLDDASKIKVEESLKEYFSPEFLNRIDDVIIFNKLSEESIEKITSIMLDELKEETKERNIKFTYSPEVIKYIAHIGFNAKFGARPIKRTIQKYIEDLIAIEYIKGNIKENSPFNLEVLNDNICISNFVCN